MNLTGFLILELTDRCNLGGVHTACPNRSPERWATLPHERTLTDEEWVRIAERFYQEFGFTGAVGFHYYNSPLIDTPRVLRVVRAIRARVPQATFCLWTNGTLLPADCSGLAIFSQVHVSDYTRDGFPPRNMAALRAACPRVQVHPGTLDRRLQHLTSEHDAPCLRPFTEFIIDHFGNVHLCCYDWRGEATMGNVLAEPLERIVERFQAARAAMAGHRMTADAPAACRRCAMRTGNLSRFVEGPHGRAQSYVAQLRKPRPGVVFAHYNCPDGDLPESRLREQLAWNEERYRGGNARVYVVTDKPHVLPSYARCLVVPLSCLPQRDGRPVFSQAMAKNRGVSAALADGCDPIIVTDTDIQFTAEAWQHMLAVDARTARVPTCVMRTRIACPDPQDYEDKGCTGTVAMRAANWRRLAYNERYVGYGGEDGEFINRLVRSGVRLDRTTQIHHMPHVDGQSPLRTPGSGAEQCYNRANGFNPDLFEVNRKRRP